MDFSHQQLQTFARWFIILIWTGGFLAILMLLQSPESPVVVHGKATADSVAFSTTIGIAVPVEPEVPMPAERAVSSTSIDLNNELLVFHSKSAFLEYFESQYSVEELLHEYDAALVKSGGTTQMQGRIVVQPNTTAQGKRFDQQYKLKVKFDIKPVPQ